jgi:hypothetical protein
LVTDLLGCKPDATPIPPERKATADEIAAVDFEPLSRERMTPDDLHGLTAKVHNATALALHLLEFDKRALVQKIEEEHDVMGSALMLFKDAADQAESVVGVLRAAEYRMAAGLAVVDGRT